MRLCNFWIGRVALSAAFAVYHVVGTSWASEVVTYPAPPEEPRSQDFEVWADGKPVDVYTARVLDPPFAGKQWDLWRTLFFCQLRHVGVSRRANCVEAISA